MDNLETLATLGKHDTGQRQTKQKKTTQKTKKMKNIDPTKKQGVNSVVKGKEFMPLIKHLSCYSYSQYALDITMRKQAQIT